MDAFRLGFRILAGIAVFQFILCLGLARVVLLDEKPEEDVQLKEISGPSEVREAEKSESKVNVRLEERAVGEEII